MNQVTFLFQASCNESVLPPATLSVLISRDLGSTWSLFREAHARQNQLVGLFAELCNLPGIKMLFVTEFIS